MQYLGGKAKLGKRIAHLLNTVRQPEQPYWEPFCGSCWVLMHIRGGARFASDACYELVEMWQALQDGWEPPTVVSEEMYREAKAGQHSPRLRGFIGFGCSFGGKWFAGYARGNTSPAMVAKMLKRKIGQLHDVSFSFADYTASAPTDHMLIYADPPYAGTESYDGAAFSFDTGEFWQTARQWTGQGHTVVVSEYQAPADFLCVCEFPTTTEIRTRNGREPRTERLFMHKSQAYLIHDRIQVQLTLEAFGLGS